MINRAKGQTLVEYGLLVALIAIVAIVALLFLGPVIANTLSETGSQIENPSG